MGKTYVVQPNWFLKTDKCGNKISSWCKKVSDDEIICFLCNKNISCSSKGFAALTQHENSHLHQQNVDLKLSKNQLVLKNTIATPSNMPSTSVQLFNKAEASVKAEIIWAMKSVVCNMAVRSCDDIKEVFESMFPGCIPENFSLGRTKLSYLITEALGPYFFKQLLQQIKSSYYVLLFDETTNNENKKELQIVVRFWSEEEKQVVTHHFQTIFLGHAKANNIVSSIRQTVLDANLSFDKLLMIGCDGPNVNKAVKKMLNSQLLEERGKPLLDIGSCNIHIVHTAFLKGIEQLGEQVTDLLINIHNFFKGFPSRWEDYENIQIKVGVPLNRFIKHVPTRWLTLAPAAERLIEQWLAEHYFLKYIPLKCSELMTTPKYRHISKALKIVDIKLECEFIVESAKLFTKFTEHFQKTEPLIHILDDELKKTLKIIAGRICKRDMINVNELICYNSLLPVREIDCNAVKNNATLTEKDKLSFLIKVQKHYIASFNYLVAKFTKEGTTLLPHFKCLQPAEISKFASIERINKIAQSMPFKNFDTLALKDEWRLLQLCSPNLLNNSNNKRIDLFWSEIIYSVNEISKTLNYPHIAEVVKAALCLSHGNSDVERGFSISGRILTKEKASMSEKMLNCRLIIQDSLKKYRNHVAEVPITKELLDLSYNACKSYKMYIEEQKRKEEMLKNEKEKSEKEKNEKLKKEKELLKEFEQKNARINEMEKRAKEEEKQKIDAQKSSDALLKEANERLAIAVNKNDLHGIRVAQGLLAGAEELREKEREYEEANRKTNKIVDKRKSSLINSYFKAKVTKQ